MAPMAELQYGQKYYIMLEFNGVSLGNRLLPNSLEIQYATWQKNLQGSAEGIRYFHNGNDAINEQQAMRDFCVRSKLLRECELLTGEALPEIETMLGRLVENGQEFRDKELLGALQKQAHEIMHQPKEMVADKQALEQIFEEQLDPQDFVVLD